MTWLTVIVICGPLGCFELTAATSSEAECLAAIEGSQAVVQAMANASGAEVGFAGSCWPATPEPERLPPAPPASQRGLPV